MSAYVGEAEELTPEMRHRRHVMLGPGRASSGLGWVDPPPGLELLQVHYLVRHGQRTPVRTRMQNSSPPIPTRWSLCHAARSFRASVVDLASDQRAAEPLDVDGGMFREDRTKVGLTSMRFQRRAEHSDAEDRAVRGSESECLLGELTDLGRATTQSLGRAMRALYVERLGLLPREMRDADAERVYFRSTNMSRTVESLQSLVRGLLPEAAAGRFTPEFLIRNGTDENLLPNMLGCSRLRHLDEHFAQLAAAVHNPRLTELDAAVSPHLDGRPPRVDGHPRLNGVLDTVRAAQAHSIDVPEVFKEEKVQLKLERAVVDEWFNGYHAEDAKVRTQYRRLAMGRFLNDLCERMTQKADLGDDEVPLRMAVYSAHDTSIGGLLGTLDVFDHRWPNFTASIGVELFRDASPTPAASSSPSSPSPPPPPPPPPKRSLLSSVGLGGSGASGAPKARHYVRARYGDTTLRLPACAAEGKHLAGSPEFCTLEAFVEIARALRHPEGRSWEHECSEGRRAAEGSKL